MKRFHTAWFLAILLLVAATGSVAVAKTTHGTNRRTVQVARRRARRDTTSTTLAKKPTTVAPTTTPTTTTPTSAGPAAAAMANLPAAIMATTKPCVGVPMLSGQADIDARPQGTKFCLSGMHHWTLTPKSNDTIRGTANAVLDGNNWSTTSAVIAAPGVSGVVLWNIEIRNYATQGDAFGAITVPDPPNSLRWFLINLYVHDNGKNFGGDWLGAGTELGTGWVVVGGRYAYNRQEGLTAGGDASNDTLTSYGPLTLEIDHNAFQADHVTPGGECGNEAGGFKLVADNVRVQYASVHDNACKGLWTDINSSGTVFTNNLVYDNWDEGIFLEISSNTTVSDNTVYGNGWHNYNGDGRGCPWLFGGGISLNSSDHADIFNNNVYRNCNGITGVQQDRPDGRPGLLEYVAVHDNLVAGPAGVTGAAEDNGANLKGRSITFSKDGFTNGMDFCALSC
jgi:parallel beta-helix repeat protein